MVSQMPNLERNQDIPPTKPLGVNGAAFTACDVMVEDLGAANVPGVKEGESTLKVFLFAKLNNRVSFAFTVSRDDW